ncbi:unnamed protein product [Peniophora sp. CBMAI 1063]|nr:unnamed protein product [Peniophora sp. CBMAI 1063]
MGDVYDDMPPLVERPLAPPPPSTFLLPPIDDNDDDLPPLVERPALPADGDLPPLVVDTKAQSRWEFISDEPLEPATGPIRTAKEGKETTNSGPPKPPNAFILFRASFVKANPVPREAERDHATLSKIIGLVWRGLDSDEKVKWEKKAGQAREEWRAKNPDWRFSKAGNGFIGYTGGGTGKNSGGGGGGTKAKGTRKKKKGSQKERCEAIAGLIAKGVKDGALADAIQNWDATSSPSPPPVEMPRKKPKTRTRMAPYVKMLSFDEEVKPEPVDSPKKPQSLLPAAHRESPAPVIEAPATPNQDYSCGTEVSNDLGAQYQSIQGYHFGSFNVNSSPVNPATIIGPSSPPPVDNGYAPPSPATDVYSANAAVGFDASSMAATDAGGYSPADAYYSDRRSSYASTFSGQDTPVTPNIFGQDSGVYNGGYSGYNNGYDQTIASNYAYSTISPPGSPAVFSLPNSSLDHNSSYSTLSGWNGTPTALTDEHQTTTRPYHTGVFNASPTPAPLQGHTYDAKAYNDVFSTKNAEPASFATKPLEPVVFSAKNVEPTVYNAADTKHAVYPAYQAPYTAGVHTWNAGAGAPWAQVGYAYA